MTTAPMHRRAFLRHAATAAGAFAFGGQGCATAPLARKQFKLAAFSADVTPPIGHPCMGGGIAPVQRIEDPLFARGFVLLGDTLPTVFVAVDWCEIRNDAFERWRAVLAEAAGTVPGRVLVSSVHQHDAPVADLQAERILEARQATGRICDLDFHEIAVQGAAAALRESLRKSQRVSHLGLGQARVEKVASNRRFLGPDGKPLFGRTSSTRDPLAQAAPEGTIDPWLKTLSFWNGNQPVAAASFYATHPMSYYGKGGASSDFVGLARQRRHRDDPTVTQIYVSGCSGNVTAGKYNDGSPENRPVLADRIYQAMTTAWKATQLYPLKSLAFRSVPLRLEPRNSPGFTVDDLNRRLSAPEAKPFDQCLAALGLSWRQRADAGHAIEVPLLDFGPAQLLLLPAESYVEYQLLAQRLRPHSFVAVAGYGECAPGYIPTERAWEEGDGNLHDWCWVAPGAERAMTAALEAVLKVGPWSVVHGQ
ncbi:MAG: hypothetical protein AAB466_07495 [Verrucomicrobiota bacterium]